MTYDVWIVNGICCGFLPLVEKNLEYGYNTVSDSVKTNYAVYKAWLGALIKLRFAYFKNVFSWAHITFFD